MSDIITVPTAEKDRMIQLLRYHNFVHRYEEDKLDTSAWLSQLLTGVPSTQANIPPWIINLDWCATLWNAYRTQLHTRHYDWLSSPGLDQDVNAENAVIPNPPNQP